MHRRDVRDEVEDGILGSFTFNENGDPSLPKERSSRSPPTARVADDALAEVAAVISPPAELVEAARAG